MISQCADVLYRPDVVTHSKDRLVPNAVACVRLLLVLNLQSLIEDFHCALHKKILLQGRLYIFQQHICFYSNLFGFVKRKVIPLQASQFCRFAL